MTPCSRALRFKSLTLRWAPCICFVPRCDFLSPRPRFLLSYPLFGFSLLSALRVYSGREPLPLVTFCDSFPSLRGWIPFPFPFRLLCPPLVPYGCPLWSSVWGPLSSLTYPSWCFMDLCLARWGFFFVCSGFFWSYSSHWTLRFLPQLRRCLPFCPPRSEYLHTQCRSLMAKVACT